MSLEPGELVEGKYRIVNLIGEGGMGAVYEGENVRIHRRVAIKVLHAAFTANAEVIQRFEREAQAAGRIGNDHILEVLDMGSLANGDHFMVMEFLEGETLSGRIKRLGRMAPQALAPLAKQMLAGLSAAHAAGIIHRDLKPDNVFIMREKAGKRDFVKIIDFGISKFSPLSGDGMKMTRTGAVMGTPYYMSPEQASGSSDADARSDLYSVAVMLYEAVTGRVPFDASTFNQLMFKIVLSDSPPPQSIVPDLDPAFCTLIGKGMSRDVRYRFQTAVEFMQAIDAWLESGRGVSIPPPAQPNGLVPPDARAQFESISGAAAAPIPATASRPDAAPARATAGSWATSQADVVIPKKGPSPLVAVGIAVGMLVLGGSAVAAFKLIGKKDVGAADTVTAAPAAALLPPAAATTATPEAPSVKPAAEPSVEPKEASANVAPAESAQPALSARQAARAAAAKEASRRKPEPKSASKADPKPEAKPAAPKPAAKSGGLDFGY